MLAGWLAEGTMSLPKVSRFAATKSLGGFHLVRGFLNRTLPGEMNRLVKLGDLYAHTTAVGPVKYIV